MSSGRFQVPEGLSIASDAKGVSEGVHQTKPATQNAFPATSFPNNELPFGGSGWLHGFSDGGLWTNIRTTPGKAFGTQFVGSANYTDSIACLAGNWLSDQTVKATVITTNRQLAVAAVEEVELLLRFSIGPGFAKGYEITFSVISDNAYVQLNRWDGPLAGYVLIGNWTPATLNNGDTVEASVVGSTFTVKINGSTLSPSPNPMVDSTYTSGTPGIGHYLTYLGAPGTILASDFGLSAFSATAV